MTEEHDYDERSEKLRKFKEKLGAQEKELEKLLAKLEDLEAKRAEVIKEIGNTSSTPQYVKEPLQQMSKLMVAINNLPEVKSIAKCEICGKLYVSGNCHECLEAEK
ncbi:hypothetical protein MSHOH_1305 [Methanosarcina horonobensis HB-1 = JCM 15518]|uniref:Uncharacterized protein n=1 Tax=Methanosarcina horonobensis HB-1 = JCM 15518 TaxID=1434110 RepID=A0A0E3SE72_9EURY|nr:hypothetical protein [Methanosarcina horonobensis]AKB77788.1 hypothetical protein MSHOH_1305 [Methanosarcina horonobensis HB-1 = JCM 15518]